jgi:hypothetical protein
MDVIHIVQIIGHNRTTFFTQVFIVMDVGTGNVTFEALYVENVVFSFLKKFKTYILKSNLVVSCACWV